MKIRTVCKKQRHNSAYKQKLTQPQCCQLWQIKTWTQVCIITVMWENIATLLQIFYSYLNDMKTIIVCTKQWYNSVYKQELAQSQCCQPSQTKTWTQVNIITVTNCTTPAAEQLSGYFLFKFLHVQKATRCFNWCLGKKKFLQDIQVNTLHITLHSIISQIKANFMVPSMVMIKLSLHTPWKPYRGQRRYTSTHS